MPTMQSAPQKIGEANSAASRYMEQAATRLSTRHEAGSRTLPMRFAPKLGGLPSEWRRPPEPSARGLLRRKGASTWVRVHRNGRKQKEGDYGTARQIRARDSNRKNLRFEGRSRNNVKLVFKGMVNSQDEANKIWDAIKTIPDWPREVQADIKVNPCGSQENTTGTAGQARRRRTRSKPGGHAHKIAKEGHLGDANAYQESSNANREPSDGSRQDQAGTGTEDSFDGTLVATG